MTDVLISNLKYYGLTEKAGPGSDERLIELIRSVAPWAQDDSSVAWCGIYMTHLFKINGLKPPSKSMAARSWLKVGNKVDPYYAEPGDLVVFWRRAIDDWRGHVGQFINWTEDGRIRVLGGNQNNSVSIRIYGKERILGIRRV